MSTEVFIDEYRGYPVFAIWNIDQYGNKTGGKPVVSFGLTKALAILNHLDQVQKWVDEQKQTRKAPSQQPYSRGEQAGKPRITIKKKESTAEKPQVGETTDDALFNNSNLTPAQIELLRMFSRK
jgi:hypothetical protein